MRIALTPARFIMIKSARAYASSNIRPWTGWISCRFTPRKITCVPLTLSMSPSISTRRKPSRRLSVSPGRADVRLIESWAPPHSTAQPVPTENAPISLGACEASAPRRAQESRITIGKARSEAMISGSIDPVPSVAYSVRNQTSSTAPYGRLSTVTSRKIPGSHH